MVKVPQKHVKDDQINLNVSPNAIQGWFSDNEAISFSARFSGKAQQIYIPKIKKHNHNRTANYSSYKTSKAITLQTPTI